MKSFFAAHTRLILILILALSVLLRLIVAVMMGNDVESLPGINDQITYHTLSLRILDGHGFSFGQDWWPATQANAPTAHWSYFYTFYLVIVYGLFGPVPLAARLIQVVIVGILHPWLVYTLGKIIFNRTVGLIAAFFTAVYIYFIYYSAALLTEPFYITFVLGVLCLTLWIAETICCLERVSWLRIMGYGLGLGVLIAMATLLRQLFLLIIPFLFLWLLWSLRRRLLPTIAILVVAVLVIGTTILPFTLYNYARFQRFVLLNTNAGFAFYWANHPIYGTQFESIISAEKSNYLKMLPKDLPYEQMNEAELDQEMLRRGLQFVWQDPLRYIALSASRILTYFVFWPSAKSSLISNLSRVFSFGILLPWMLYGMVLAWLRRPRRDLLSSSLALLLLFMILYAVIHLLTWTLIRYRLPIDAVALIFAGYALPDAYQRLTRRKKRAATATN